MSYDKEVVFIFCVIESILLPWNGSYSDVLKYLRASRKGREFNLVVCLSKASVFYSAAAVTA